MRIALFHELHNGGARRAANDFASYLNKNNTVDLYSTDILISDEEKENYSNIYQFKFVALKWLGRNWKIKLYKDTLELIKLSLLHKKIASKIDKENYDLVFIHPSQYTQAPFILRYLKTKKIYYCQENLRLVYDDLFLIDKNINPLKYIYEKLNRKIRRYIDSGNIHAANLILANSKFTQLNIKNAYKLKSKICYMGIDTKKFKSQNIPKKYDTLYIGAEDETDGYSLLKQAKEYLDKKIVVHTHISGKDWLTDKKYIAQYSEAKICLCLAKHEPFGLIPLEAMACGIPVIALKDGGYQETVKDNFNGYLVSPNPKQLAETITKLLKNSRKRMLLSKQAQNDVIENWSWETRIKELESIFASIIK